MISVALLSNPSSTGNREILPRIRDYCAGRPDIFHYEVDKIEQIGVALESIARVKPRVLVINGGDGTVQAALTELHNGGQFGREPPPVAVLPNGKTNLIALDLGAVGDPLAALEKIAAMAKADLASHVVQRELIALTEGDVGNRPVLGMFLGGAGLADAILYCRHKIYPLGLPNGVSHVLATLAVLASVVFGLRGGRHLLPATSPVAVSLIRGGGSPQPLSVLIVTTLEKVLLNTRTVGSSGMRLMAVDQSSSALVKALWASARGRLGKKPVRGVHLEQGDVIRIESDDSSVILDGEEFHAERGRPIVLRSTPPVPFLRLAA